MINNNSKSNITEKEFLLIKDKMLIVTLISINTMKTYTTLIVEYKPKLYNKNNNLFNRNNKIIITQSTLRIIEITKINKNWINLFNKEL